MCAMLRKITFFSSAIVMSSSLFAMHNGNGSLVLSNQPSLVQNYHFKPYSSTNAVPVMAQNQSQKKKPTVKKGETYTHDSSLNAILIQAAEEQIKEINRDAKMISDTLNEKYVEGSGQWSLKPLYLEMNIHTGGSESIANIIAELNWLSERFSFNKSGIVNKVREINRRFDSLIQKLTRTKMRNYQRIESCSGWEYDCSLQSWQIDPFFNKQDPHGGLNPSLQKYVQEEVENKYKDIYARVFPFSNEPHAPKEHALRKTAEYAMHVVGGIQWLNELLKTQTFKNLPSERKIEVKKDICAKIKDRCSWDSVKYNEGKLCDGELKQECQ